MATECKDIKQDYVCFDLETTGFGRAAEIIDIGAVKVRDGEIVDTFSELVKPHLPISRKITELTGITNEMVRDSRGIEAVLPDFFAFIGEDVLVGHNIATFDIPMVRRHAAVAFGTMFEPSYIDTVYLSKTVQGVTDNKLQTMLDHYGIDNARAHRAFEDSEATSKLFAALVADGIAPDVRRSFSYTSVEEYQRQASIPKGNIDIPYCDEVLSSVKGLYIVLTGEFEFGSSDDVMVALLIRGATVRKTMSGAMNYLVVGDLDSDSWKYDKGGKKVKEAIKYGVKIIHESAISDVLRSEKEKVYV